MMTSDYKEHCTAQGTAVSPTMAQIKKIMQDVCAKMEKKPITNSFSICDYGCALGRNSIELLSTIINQITKAKGDQVFSIYLNDLPQNDFSITFEELQPIMNERVFLFAAGKNFYEQVLPCNSLNFGFSLNSVHWLDSPWPTTFLKGGCVFPMMAKVSDRMQWKEKAQLNWLKFLQWREKELVPGGKLLIAGFGLHENTYSFNGAILLIPKVWNQMFFDGKITKKEFESFILPMYLTTSEDLAKPFKDKKVSLILDDEPVIVHSPCVYYREFLEDKNATKFGKGVSNMIKSVCKPTMMKILERFRKRREAEEIVEEFWNKVAETASRNPNLYKIDNVTILLSCTKGLL